MTFETISADFYGFENKLTDQEKDLIVRLRAFLDEHVRPVANDGRALPAKEASRGGSPLDSSVG